MSRGLGEQLSYHQISPLTVPETQPPPSRLEQFVAPGRLAFERATSNAKVIAMTKQAQS